MKNIKRPVWKEVIAFATEIFDQDDQQIMIEIIRAYSEQNNKEQNTAKSYQAIDNALKGKMDTNDFDTMVNLVATLLRNGDPLTDQLSKFAADVLDGKRSRPTKRGPDPYRDFGRNVRLSFATEAVARKFSIARYAKGNNTSETAVDAVSNAFKCSVNTVTHALSSYPIAPSVIESVIKKLGTKLG
jgi:hypothetical protein